MELVYDTEGDGFRDESTRLWCLVAKDLETGTIFQFGPDEISDAIKLLGQAEVLICHNQIGHDLPILQRLYGWSPSPGTRIVDTYILSLLLWPDRPNPEGYKGKGGPHSIEAWGYRMGRWKPEHDDWSQFSPEMLHRCTEDVEIQALVYKELLKEMET